MSSLPPYNPGASERSVWLLNAVTSNPERQLLMDSVGSCEVIESTDETRLVERVRGAKSGVLVVAPEATLEGLVLDLLGGRRGTARLRFRPGVLSQVQMLPDRAVLRHLNIGRAV